MRLKYCASSSERCFLFNFNFFFNFFHFYLLHTPHFCRHYKIVGDKMNPLNAKELFIKYREGRCNDEEIAWIESWYLQHPDKAEEPVFTTASSEAAKAKIWASLPVHAYLKEQPKIRRLGQTVYYARVMVAAMLLLAVSVGFYFYKARKEQAPVANKQAAIKPGTRKAILTLGDGRTIALNDANKGLLAQDKGTNVLKTADNQLVYQAIDNSADNAVEFHTIAIPRGGYYTLTLSDGTKVWLNAESSLRYPSEFTHGERIVELTGEGYFEVAHRNKQPFKVVTAGQTTEVLGTHFNINAYADQGETITTLLEGSIKLHTPQGASQMLKPGEQAHLVNNKFSITYDNINDAIDWTSNQFIFHNESLSNIMNAIGRWYDVEVVCPEALGKLTFSGEISRNKNIHQVLNIMDLTKMVNFKIEGRRITVTQ